MAQPTHHKDDFELLFSSPFVWKPPVTTSFLKAVHNLLKQKNPSSKIRDMKTKLLANSHLVFPNNWSDVLGPTDFNILKSRQPKNLNTASVVDLLAVLRNKYEHFDEFTDPERGILGWSIHNSKSVDDFLFVKYWNNLFPCLVPLLWWKFYEFKAELKEYYHCAVTNQDTRDLGDLTNFTENLELVLKNQLDQGGLLTRFKLTHRGNAKTVEFRNFEVGLAQKVLSGSKYQEVKYSKDTLDFIWYENILTNEKLEISYKKFTVDQSEFWREGLTIVITNGSDETDFLVLEKLLTNQVFNSKNTIMFTNKNVTYIDQTLAKISAEISIDILEEPVNWNDLRNSRQTVILNDGKMVLQNNEVHLSEIFSMSPDSKLTALDHLNGDILNALLENTSPVLFTKIESQIVPEIYIERQLYNLNIVSSVVFECGSDLDLFLVNGMSLEDLGVLVDNKNVVAFPSDLNDFQLDVYNTNVFHASDDSIQTVASEHEKMLSKHNIHLLRYHGDKKFNWLKTFGTFSTVEAIFKKASKEIGMVEEGTLIEKLCCENETSRIVFIGDKPGMGKTQVLISLASKITKRCENKKVVMFASATDFVSSVVRKNGNISSNLVSASVTEVIKEMSCTNDFEKYLIHYWLQSKESNGIRLELMLDGLDEVSHELQNFALETIKFIHNEFVSIRLWVTLRDHMFDRIRKEFNCLGYKLEPFSKTVQIGFLETYWLKYCRQFCEPGKLPSSKLLRKSAKHCVKTPISSSKEVQITGIPLQCRMIAEIYEREVALGLLDFNTHIEHNLVALYEKLIERKLEILLKEKKKLSIDMKDFIVSILRENLERSHTIYAIKLIFSDKMARKLQNHFMSTQVGLGVLEYGIVQKLEPLAFVHRTFAEFKIAQFIYKVLTGEIPNISKDQPYFQNFIWNHALAFYAPHISGYDFIKFRYPAIAYFLNILWEKETMKLDPEYFTFLKCIGQAIKPKFSPRYLDTPSPFVTARWMQHNKLFALVVTSSSNLIDLFILTLLLRNYQFSIYLIENYFDFKPQNWSKFQNYDESQYGLVHWIIKGLFLNNVYYDENRWSESTESAKSFLKYVVDMNGSILEQKDGQGRTPLLFLLSCEHATWSTDIALVLDIIKYLIQDLKSNVDAVDNYKNTVLHITTWCNFEEKGPMGSPSSSLRLSYMQMYYNLVLFCAENRYAKNIINSLNSKGHTPLYDAFQSEHLMHLDIFKLFKYLGADFNLKYEDGNTIFNLAILKRRWGYLLLYQVLIECGADIFVGNNKGQCAIHLAVGTRTYDLVQHLLKTNSECVYVRDNNGKNVLEYKTSDGIQKLLQHLINKIIAD